jgi:hypothetical protein
VKSGHDVHTRGRGTAETNGILGQGSPSKTMLDSLYNNTVDGEYL